jgi:hypothetical protein
MTVKRKSSQQEKHSQKHVEAIINRGGKTTSEIKDSQSEGEIRFTLRIPQKLIDEIDKDRKSRIGSVSRNQWILEAIANQIKQKH